MENYNKKHKIVIQSNNDYKVDFQIENTNWDAIYTFEFDTVSTTQQLCTKQFTNLFIAEHNFINTKIKQYSHKKLKRNREKDDVEEKIWTST